VRIILAAITGIAVIACSTSAANAVTISDLIKFVPASAASCDAAGLVGSGGEAGVIYHQGGYVAEVHLSLVSGEQVQGTVLLGQCAHIKSTALNASIAIYSHTGLVWAPKKLFYSGHLDGRCIYLWGTTLEPRAEVRQSDCTPY